MKTETTSYHGHEWQYEEASDDVNHCYKCGLKRKEAAKPFSQEFEQCQPKR